MNHSGFARQLLVGALGLCSVIWSSAAGPAAEKDASSGWSIVANDFEGTAFLCPQIAFSPKGRLCVSFQDGHNGKNGSSVMRWNGTAFDYLGQRSHASRGVGWYNHLAFDRQDNVYIITRDYGLCDGHVMRFEVNKEGVKWEDAGTPPNLNEEGTHWTHLALDSKDVVYAVYTDRGTNPDPKTKDAKLVERDKVSVQRLVAGKWEYVGPRGFSAGFGRHTAIAIDRADVPWVAFQNHPQGSVSVMKYHARENEWRLVQPTVAERGANVNLVMDRHGVPHVAFINGRELWVYQLVDGRWAAVGSDASGDDVPVMAGAGWRQWLPLRFDTENRPVVFYASALAEKTNTPHQREGTVRRFNGKSWDVVGKPRFTPGAIEYPVMDLDPEGHPWVAFKDTTKDGRLTVMRFRP